MSRTVFTFFAMLCWTGFLGVLFSDFSPSRPNDHHLRLKASLGFALFGAYFTRASVREHRLTRASRAPVFLKEVNRIRGLLPMGSRTNDIPMLLSTTYRLVSDASGFKLRFGRLRVIDYTSALVAVRVLAQNGSIVAIEFTPAL